MIGTVAHCTGCGAACEPGFRCAGPVAGCARDCPADRPADCDGACVDTETDPAHCGACGRRCAVPRATAACRSGACGIAACDPGYGHCNADLTDGCETDLNTSLDHCGGCGDRCLRANAAPACIGGTCRIGACNAGWGNCDDTDANGCETDVTSSNDHCGRCGNRCSPPNAAGACAAGDCGIGSCNPGYADCDGMAGNGCEAELARDTANCGACGNGCAPGTECVDGVCDPIAQAAPGTLNGCAVRRSGTIECWGANEAGQIAPPELVPSGVPRVFSGLRARAITAGGSFACAIETGTDALYCWGRGQNGELGYGMLFNRGTPQRVMPEPAEASAFTGRFRQVAAQGTGACALDDAGQVWCWGRNQQGQNGAGTLTPESQPFARRVVGLPPGDPVVELAVGTFHGCGRTMAGQVWCWGRNAEGQLGRVTSEVCSGVACGLSAGQVPGLSGVTALRAAGAHTCVIDPAGLKCWGRNGDGELGVGDTTNRATPTGVTMGLPVGVPDDLVATGNMTFVRYGSAWYSTGRGIDGALGDGMRTSRNRFAPVPQLEGFDTVFGGAPTLQVYARRGGRLFGFGADDYGQCGVRDGLVRLSPARVRDGTGPVGGVTALYVGERQVALTAGDQLRTAGQNNGALLGVSVNTVAARGTADVVMSFGSQVGPVAQTQQATCAIVGVSGSRRVRCVGTGSRGELGRSGTTASLTPVDVELPAGVDAFAIAAGTQHFCALVIEAGERVPYCWGRNNVGQLGRVPASDPPTGFPVPERMLGGVVDAVQIVAGDAHTCVRRATGQVLCAGWNAAGQLGIGSTVDTGTLTAVPGIADATELAAGSLHTCVLRTGGRVWCWGQNNRLQLGLPDGIARTSPAESTALGPLEATALGAGGRHTCAIVAGTVRCWGENNFGQLGAGVRGDPSATALDTGLTMAVSVGGARAQGNAVQHTCARLLDGSAWCWGECSQGRCGTGESMFVTTPTLVQFDY
jgi:alpha-tubulin suppressor-like RCC1 family protein